MQQSEDMADEYRKKFSEYRLMVAEFAAKIGWNFIPYTTDKRPEELLMQIYNMLAVKNNVR